MGYLAEYYTQAELTALEKDAMRYRFLRDARDANWRPFALKDGLPAHEADALVDKAMK